MGTLISAPPPIQKQHEGKGQAIIAWHFLKLYKIVQYVYVSLALLILEFIIAFVFCTKITVPHFSW